MANVISFPGGPRMLPEERYKYDDTIGARAGLSVQILSRISQPHDLLVVLHGTAEGRTTIAAVPAGERAVADVIAHSTLAALDAAGRAWQIQNGPALG